MRVQKEAAGHLIWLTAQTETLYRHFSHSSFNSFCIIHPSYITCIKILPMARNRAAEKKLSNGKLDVCVCVEWERVREMWCERFMKKEPRALFMFFHNIILNIYSEKATVKSGTCEHFEGDLKINFDFIAGLTVKFFISPAHIHFISWWNFIKNFFSSFYRSRQFLFLTPQAFYPLLITPPPNRFCRHLRFMQFFFHSIEEALASSPHGYIMMMLIRKIALFSLCATVNEQKTTRL